MIDKKVLNIINEILYTKEFPQEFKKEDVVSVNNLFEIYKNRAKTANEFYTDRLNEAGYDLAFLKQVDVAPSNGNVLVHILLRLANGKTCVIDMDKEHNIKMKDYFWLNKIPDDLFKKYYDLFKLLCTYAIVNNYNEDIRLNTISNEFQILPKFNEFCITMPSKILEGYQKYMYLSYPYTKANSKAKDIINTDMGNFELETNIRGIKKVLSSKGEYNNERIDNIARLLQNLQVYESDIPDYIKLDMQKIKTLKK